jgi:hypothetical protein
MRYKHETFNKMILKDGFISFLFKFRCSVSPAVIFSDRHLNFDRELNLFLNYMRYKHETFTNMILKDGSII